MAESKLVWNPDNVRDTAEAVGISSLNEEAVRALSQDVEYRLSEVITEAMRFMHQSKRTVLTTQDISQALKVLNIEPLYGYESTRPLRFGEASLGPGQPLFYIEDEEVDFEKLINAPLPKVPRDVSFTSHWLAVEGVQPSIPQNPTTAEARASELVPKGPGAAQALAALAGNDNVAFRPLVKHVLSKELVLYFNRITSGILNESQDPEVVSLRKAAFESIRSDPGLHQLLPYLVQFICEKITHCLDNIFVLRQMMELTQAVTENKSLFLAPYVNSLIPAILTCNLGEYPGGKGADILDEQYQLRDFASSLLGIVAKKYSNSSGDIKTRVVRTCLKVWLEAPIDHTLGALYGAITGMGQVCGPVAIESLIIRNVKHYEYVWKKAERDNGPNDEGLRMLLAATLKTITSIVGDEALVTNGANTDANEEQEIEDYLGPTIGQRVVALGNNKLNKALLESKKKAEEAEKALEKK